MADTSRGFRFLEMLARIKNRIAALSLQLADYPRVQNAYLGLMKQIKPPSYREDNMETVTGSWRGASSARCVEGRQFGENNVFPSYYRERHYETTVGKLGGSRAGCPINTSALRSVLRNWNDAIEIIDFLRSKYIDRLGLQGKPLSYVDLYVLSNIGTSIPAYLLRRHTNPVPSGRIPSPVGATYKLVAGLEKIVTKMISRCEPWMPNGEVFSGAQLYAYADAGNLFLAPDGEACGGPERMVIELLEIATRGRPVSVNRAHFRQEFFSLVSDAEAEALVDYGIKCALMKLAFMSFAQETAKAIQIACSCKADTGADRFIHESLLSALGDKVGGLQASLPTLERRIEILTYAIERFGVQAFDVAARSKQPAEAIQTAMDKSDLLAGLSQECRRQVAVFLERYLEILHHADNFAHERQQEINHILGRARTARVAVRKLSNRINERLLGVIQTAWRLRLRDLDARTVETGRYFSVAAH